MIEECWIQIVGLRLYVFRVRSKSSLSYIIVPLWKMLLFRIKHGIWRNKYLCMNGDNFGRKELKWLGIKKKNE
jgi:hypothetical protein